MSQAVIELQVHGKGSLKETGESLTEGPGDDDSRRTSTVISSDSTPPPAVTVVGIDDFVEGGYGWVVLASCGILTFFFVGTTYSWGIIQSQLVIDRVAPAATLAWVGSLTVALNSVFAIMSSRFVRAYGARKAGLLGALFLGGGEFLSGWTSKEIRGLFVTEGVVMGIGVSLCFMAVSIPPAQYFRRRRGLANGIVFASGGFGGAITSLTLDALIDRLGVAWTFRTLGLVTITVGCTAASFIRERRLGVSRENAFIDWTLFRNPIFTLLFVSAGLATFTLFVPPFFLPLYATSIGLSKRTGAILVAGFNFSSAIGRLGLGQAADMFGPINTLLCSLSLIAISMLAIWPVSTSLAPLILFVVLNGIANGGFFSLMPTVVGSVFGVARVGVALGMIVTGWAGGYLMGAPIAGYLLNAYGGTSGGLEAYRPAMFYAGSIALASAGLLATVRLKLDSSLTARL